MPFSNPLEGSIIEAGGLTTDQEHLQLQQEDRTELSITYVYLISLSNPFQITTPSPILQPFPSPLTPPLLFIYISGFGDDNSTTTGTQDSTSLSFLSATHDQAVHPDFSNLMTGTSVNDTDYASSNINNNNSNDDDHVNNNTSNENINENSGDMDDGDEQIKNMNESSGLGVRQPGSSRRCRGVQENGPQFTATTQHAPLWSLDRTQP